MSLKVDIYSAVFIYLHLWHICTKYPLSGLFPMISVREPPDKEFSKGFQASGKTLWGYLKQLNLKKKVHPISFKTIGI